MKLISSKAYISYLPENKLAVSFIIDNRQRANMLVNELKETDKIELTAKPYKSNRSLSQNNYMWKLIEIISDKVNGNHTEDSMNEIYCSVLLKANIKRDLIAVPYQSIPFLKSTFRAVLETGQVISTTNKETGKTAELSTIWVYAGSSRYDTKEMAELIDVIIDYGVACGISFQELDNMKGAYDL